MADLTIDELYEGWIAKGGPLDQLFTEVAQIHHRRELYNGMFAMLHGQGNPHSAYVADFLHGLYFEAQLVALRRLNDADRDTVSFRRLIGQLLHHRSEFTRQWYIGLWTQGRDPNSEDFRESSDARHWRGQGAEEFGKWIDNKRGREDVLGQGPLQRILDELGEATAVVKRYVDQHIAHTQKVVEPLSLTYAEVDKAIDHVGSTLAALKLLLEQSSLITFVPTVQGDWKSPFRAPLIDCDDNPVPWIDPCWTGPE